MWQVWSQESPFPFSPILSRRGGQFGSIPAVYLPGGNDHLNFIRDGRITKAQQEARRPRILKPLRCIMSCQILGRFPTLFIGIGGAYATGVARNRQHRLVTGTRL